MDLHEEIGRLLPTAHCVLFVCFSEPVRESEEIFPTLPDHLTALHQRQEDRLARSVLRNAPIRTVSGRDRTGLAAAC